MAVVALLAMGSSGQLAAFPAGSSGEAATPATDGAGLTGLEPATIDQAAQLRGNVTWMAANGTYVEFTLRTPAHQAPLDSSLFALHINGKLRGPPHGATWHNDTVRLSWLSGFGSSDVVRVVALPTATLPGVDFTVASSTPRDVLPAPRTHHAASMDPATGFIYIIAGRGYLIDEGTGQWTHRRVLDSILRYDPATGETRTMHARAPYPLFDANVAWDPRPTLACPQGCGYVFGGGTGNDIQRQEILRFDPSVDVALEMNARLPVEAYDYHVVFVGDRFLINKAGIAGGPSNTLGSSRWLQYDPVEGILNETASWAPTPEGRMGTAWIANDPECLAGCIYSFGRWVHDDEDVFEIEGELDGDAISRVVRFDPVTGVSTPLAGGTPGAVDPDHLPVVDGVVVLPLLGDCASNCDVPASSGAYDIGADEMSRLPFILEEPKVRAGWVITHQIWMLGGHDGDDDRVPSREIRTAPLP